MNTDDVAAMARARALLSYYAETPGIRFAMRCEKCDQLCAIRAVDCECCKNIGKSFSGSKRIRKMSPHDHVPIGPVIAELEKALAA